MINPVVLLPAGFGLLFISFSCAAENSASRPLVINKQHHRMAEANCFFWRSAAGQINKPCVEFHLFGETEAFNLRNKNLRLGGERRNTLELEPLLRLNSLIMHGRPVEGRIELEWKSTLKRQTNKPPKKQTKLELTQAYIKLTDQIIPHTEWKLGRWLYRDEREWLIDENLDGALVKGKFGRWRADAFGGRVNYWQKDLMDRASRNEDSVNIFGLLLHYPLTKSWTLGAYAFTRHDVSSRRFQQTHYGFRSHNPRARHFSHWLEAGLMEGHKEGARIRGYVLDAGGIWTFRLNRIKPRITLGYAAATKHYYQTGLHSNEAKFGGDTKFQIYGETLNPELSNIQIVTLGLGINIGEHASLDLVYHDYSQIRLSELSDDRIELNPKYDRQNSRRLGYGIDLIYGWEPVDNIKLETRLGVFNPSSRFASGAKQGSPRSQSAYSSTVEIKFAF